MEQWYYAKENEQIGPIRKDELLILIKRNTVKGEDLVWCQGMKDWKRAKEVDALEMGVDNSKAEIKNESSSNIEETFFSAEGRLRRRDYFLRIILLSILSTFLSVGSGSSDNVGLNGFLALLTLGCGILMFIQIIKRLHDINLNGAYCLASFVPVVNFIFGLYILFKDGTVGANEYGKDPKMRAVEDSLQN